MVPRMTKYTLSKPKISCAVICFGELQSWQAGRHLLLQILHCCRLQIQTAAFLIDMPAFDGNKRESANTGAGLLWTSFDRKTFQSESWWLILSQGNTRESSQWQRTNKCDTAKVIWLKSVQKERRRRRRRSWIFSYRPAPRNCSGRR